ncbi:phospholipase C, phosphocholine-specific [Solihabitans fulvus]|uniref:phospholipase C n=1 Tax=Solihabitans fulvus TaxID=1892852 RepID=A0A5B2WUG3_9PSEU|nr:phospholipase C, phosphocholine-specific [Solihabitans fulvus]KAA2254514.1 phospholipase C, phosphocholine-specific [Solihabitans fulvus]
MAESSSSINRRRFLGGVAGGVAAAGALNVLPPGMAEALAEPRRSGKLDDVQHVVILMQENRSFDHYYGTMRGVRGFGDRAAAQLSTGNDVFHQPDGGRSDGKFLLPFHVDTSKVDGQDMGDLGHGWNDQHQAIAGGANNAWIPAKGEMTMGYFTQADIPFHRALADAFTVCDNYFCSVQGPTTPNRLYLFTGTIDAEGKHGGPAYYNPADYNPVYTWKTYPERLQDAKVSWKVYANNEVGDDGAHPFVGDYGDNPLWLFQAYHDALKDPAKKDLADRAGVFDTWQPDSGKGKDVNHVLADFIADCKKGTLPRVSWVVSPYGYSEHPEARPVDGAAYTQGVLKALWDNPKLWESTVVLIDYDENDGFFDHVPPPVAPGGTPGEYVNGRSIGLGARVPMTVISPWSRGGWVNSQVFDHTSVLRFLEAWTGVRETNISAWRRAICGDLTSCFDFGVKNTTIPLLPDTAKLRAEADATESKLPKPSVPAVGAQQPPKQEPGTRRARPLPYQPGASTKLDVAAGKLGVTLTNQGATALQVSIRRTDGQTDGPWPYDVAPGATVSDTFNIKQWGGGKYDLTMHGPNGFVRRVAGDMAKPGAAVEIVASLVGGTKPQLQLAMSNTGTSEVTVTVKANHYRADGPWTYRVPAGKTVNHTWDAVCHGDGWYDLTATINTDASFARRFAGHIETGKPSVTG